MKMGIKVQFNNIIKFFGFLNYSNYSQLFVADEFIINCFKVHDHSYYYNAFFYKSRHIYSNRFFRSKKELFCAVQELLNEELYHVVQ